MGSRLAAACLLLLAGAARAEDVGDEIARIRPFPGTSEWDREVAFHLRLAFDGNRSGAIDRRREVRAIPCEVWTGIDGILAERSEYPGLLATYGFPEDLVWLGSALGFDRRVRRVAEREMRACGLRPEGPAAHVEVDPALSGTVAGMISAVPSPGSPPWTRRIRFLLVRTYDRDGSEALDSSTELRGIGCPVWQALDAALTGEGGLVVAFGLRPELPWGGERLGIAPEAAPDAWAAAVRCKLR